MTAETKVPTSKTVKVRGKRVGPANVEAKRAAALRQAASAAENERQETGVASTISFFKLLRDAAVTGVIPGNAELLATIDSWSGSPALSGESLSPTGQRLVRDVKSLLQVVARFLRERNSDELLQRFLHHVHLAGRVAGVDLAIAGWRARGKQRRKSLMTKGGRGKISIWRSEAKHQELFLGGEHSRIAGVDVARKEAAKREAEAQASPEERMRRGITKDAKALLRISQMLISSTDFRSLLGRIQSISRNINNLAREVDTAEPEQEKEIGEEYEESFEEEEYETFEEMPEERLDRELKELEREVEATSASLYASGIEEKENWTPQQSSSTAKEIDIQGRTEKDIPIPTFATVPALPIVGESAHRQEHKSSHRQERKPIKEREYTSNSARRREILRDLKHVFAQLAGNKAFSRAIRDFYFVVLKLRAKIGPEAASLTSPIEADLRYDANFRAAQDELIQLMERLAGGASLTPVIENFKKIRDEARRDYELRDFFGDWRAFFKRCTGPDSVKYLDSEEYERRGEFLLKRTESYLKPSGQYRSHLDEAYDALDAFTEGLKRDKLTQEFGNQLQKLVKEDLIGVARGERLSLRTLLSTSSLLRPDLLNDFRFQILPRILKSMQSIPLPRIEIVSGGSVLVLEDVIIPSDALVPMQMELLTSSHMTMNPKSRLFRKASTPTPATADRLEGVQGGVQVKLTSIAGQVRNVRFTLDRKGAWPEFADQGLADLRIGGRGLSILVDLVSHPASEITGRRDLRSSVLPAALVAHRVRVRIDRLNLHLHDSLHDGMYRVFGPLIGSVVKRQIETSIRDQILNVVDAVDGLLDRLSQTVVQQ